MNDLICIDDVFAPDVLAFYALHGITTPIKDKIYTVRMMKHHTTNETGILLNEIQNKEVPIKHPILGVQFIEPTWKISRFTTLSGLPVKKEELVNEEVA